MEDHPQRWAEAMPSEAMCAADVCVSREYSDDRAASWSPRRISVIDKDIGV
ncbi:hypothetical protein [Actinoallomurus sp. NPDC050550]|uniref:hypothetical protein n=1 Tax=Actinoallomurus sp. NPDC050550 TaxID=3154937 RepID=UPI0033D26318